MMSPDSQCGDMIEEGGRAPGLKVKQVQAGQVGVRVKGRCAQ